MLALGGLRAGFGRGAGSRFKEIVEKSCEEGFRKNEAEVVHSGYERYLINRDRG
jgi:shikimate kinase